MTQEQFTVLIHRIGGLLKPVLPLHHLRWHHGNELVLQQLRQGPCLAHVFDQGLGSVLLQQVNGADTRTDQVAQDEIDDAVTGTKRYGRLGAVCRERLQA
jgi:hypothetical protein